MHTKNHTRSNAEGSILRFLLFLGKGENREFATWEGESLSTWEKKQNPPPRGSRGKTRHGIPHNPDKVQP